MPQYHVSFRKSHKKKHSALNDVFFLFLWSVDVACYKVAATYRDQLPVVYLSVCPHPWYIQENLFILTKRSCTALKLIIFTLFSFVWNNVRNIQTYTYLALVYRLVIKLFSFSSAPNILISRDLLWYRR